MKIPGIFIMNNNAVVAQVAITYGIIKVNTNLSQNSPKINIRFDAQYKWKLNKNFGFKN